MADPQSPTSEVIEASARKVIAGAFDAEQSLAVAESLTGGAVASALVGVPGASSVFRLGVVSYSTELKHSVLGVSLEQLRETGPVDAEVAMQMAEGVRARAITDAGPCSVAVATTGVAGPGAADGHEPGEFFVGLAWDGGRSAQHHCVSGSRDEVRAAATIAALDTLRRFIGNLQAVQE
ncbi:CinA family protein [Humidisolicoccus flavus]|uniref:CinA family protein n=1 Tax=Humidisolicoccus flavus TaxID=3111414 RepID=UPI00324FA6A9